MNIMNGVREKYDNFLDKCEKFGEDHETGIVNTLTSMTILGLICLAAVVFG